MKKLNKREAEMVRSAAFRINTFGYDSVKYINILKTLMLKEKLETAIEYLKYLISNDGVKTFMVDFVASGAGHMTFHNCTAEEAQKKCLHKLQNGAFGNYEKLEDITIQKVYPGVLMEMNCYKDYLNSLQPVLV